ncbi:MAG: hypothetical protein KME25_27865 [Symplocastrum torsivum CPER-KK1]|uniref:Uncharacterized protein n=1 Tax=Symplocastrum torsivum CPER-KK1 TaxID=450513 RepID=A0A951PT14_9CYAN|nr:hypothetical protein [Symplocastrum torsivum CPER-KK1]
MLKNVYQLGKLTPYQGYSICDNEALPPCGGSPKVTEAVYGRDGLTPRFANASVMDGRNHSVFLGERYC